MNTSSSIVHLVESAPVQQSAEDSPESRLALLPLTDLGNAERFVRRHGYKFKHDEHDGWFRWDGKRWTRSGAKDAADRAAQETVRDIQNESRSIKGTLQDVVFSTKGEKEILLSEALAKWGRSSEAITKLSAIPKIAAAHLECSTADFDLNPWMLNVQNGTIHIVRDGNGDPVRLKPFDPADMNSKIAAVDYDPEATCPRFDRFMAEAHPRPEVRRFLMMWFGLSLTGHIGEQKMLLQKGGGGEGKSVLMDTVAHIVGEYGRTIPVESFIDQGRGRSAGGTSEDLVMLRGIRMLRTSEPERGAKLAEGQLKAATGGEPMSVRGLYGKFFELGPAFKLTMSCNYRPEITGTDEGIWRRIILVPWTVKVSKESKDPNLIDKMRAEGSGILNRLLDGLRDYLDNGLLIPKEVEEATESYRDDSDQLARFLRTATAEDPAARTQSSRLYGAFAAWAKATGETVWSQRGFSRAMKDRGYQTCKDDTIKWLGLRLVKDALDFENEASPHPSWGPGDD